jgi:hypothetical protein
MNKERKIHEAYYYRRSVFGYVISYREIGPIASLSNITDARWTFVLLSFHLKWLLCVDNGEWTDHHIYIYIFIWLYAKKSMLFRQRIHTVSEPTIFFFLFSCPLFFKVNMSRYGQKEEEEEKKNLSMLIEQNDVLNKSQGRTHISI